MRAVLAVGLLITLCASANAAPVHRFQGSLTPGPTCYRSHAAIRGSRMDRRRDPTVAVQRQRRLWPRLIVVANPGPILTIRRGAHDGVANVVAGVAMLTPCIFAFIAAVLVDHVLFSQAHSSKDRYCEGLRMPAA